MPLLSLLKRKTAERTRSHLRVGIPRALNLWSTHRFWIRFLKELGIPPGNIIFSSDTSEEQYREHGKGRIGMDSCYPVKCLAGHIGELLASRKVNVLLVPMIYSLPSFLKGHVIDNLSCTRVMMGPENIRAGFIREEDEFARAGVRYVAPFVSFAEPHLLPKQLYESLKDAFGVSYEEVERAVREGLED
ncbi:MAG TPA: activase, partial [Aquifex aeolicus]|nr:activase [Aquifex aeolicus]